MSVFVSSGSASRFSNLRVQNLLLYSFVVVSGFFIIFPQTDLIVSRYFFKAGSFYFSHNPNWIALRDFHRLSQWYLLVSMVTLVALYALWRHPLSIIAPHKVVYVVLTYALGPGVLVHSLKLLIGRARPRNLVEFGGTTDFTPAWQLARMCGHSCSFPSGESSAAAAMLPLLILVPARFRLNVAVILVPVLALVSLNRVFMGAHFLSDVVIAWTLIIGLMIWLWSRISRHADVIDGWVRLRGQNLRMWLYVR
ncbi:phosphatase PAP2 family protein [Brucella tritici]|uniref:Phosphatase PAP2 family protein n=1 Tax=Brucella tritici TaxID=94626 RepID=A0A7V7VY18_9HYPH|nr:phosphatase PAP2 family protein [Brucella tritici]KAB2659353.1 phosphatase PAP2 family protein [Brucella tritici]